MVTRIKANLILYARATPTLNKKLKRAAKSTPLNATERKAIVSLGGIFSLRMFGLFLLLPVLSLHAQQFADATPFYVGLVMGVYGFTQALFQIPYGLASDRFGRKRVIIVGLIVFMLGSIIAALSETLIMLIMGRALQGAGAVSSVILALTADLTREQQRTKSMAVIGMCIGFTFLVSIVIAPILESAIGVSGIFWMIAGLVLVAMMVLYWIVPNPTKVFQHRDILPMPNRLAAVFKMPQLVRLNIGIFCLHMVLTALFVVLPLYLVDEFNFDLSEHWKLYLLVLLCSVAGMVPFVLGGSREGREQVWFVRAILLLSVALGLFMLSDPGSLWTVGAILFVFFSAFNALEAMLPALISRVAPVTSKGSAIGIYNGFQFFGMFTGGICAGWLYGAFGVHSVFGFCGISVLLWLGIAATSGKMTLLSSKTISMARYSDSQRTRLIDKIGQLKGIEEIAMVDEETTACLTIDGDHFDQAELERIIQKERSEHDR